MGLFDDITVDLCVDGVDLTGRAFQTKDTPDQYLSAYKIDKAGQLFYEKFDIEDRSDFALGKGDDRVRGCMTRVNCRYVKCSDFSGLIHFYDSDSDFNALIDCGRVMWIKAVDD